MFYLAAAVLPNAAKPFLTLALDVVSSVVKILVNNKEKSCSQI